MNALIDASNPYRQLGWVQAFLKGLADSDARIRASSLEEGWSLVNERGRLVCEVMRGFYQQVVRQVPPRGAFAVHALGGTGRQEICPGSDVDLGIIVENIEENVEFLTHVSQQLKQFSPFVPGLENNLKANAFPDLFDAKQFDRKSLVALLDSELLVGDTEFDHRIRRICQERAAELGLEFIFQVNQDLRRFEQLYPQPPGHVGGFHVKDGQGGLRSFHLTMWLYSFERWLPSVQVYEQVRNSRRFDSEGAPTPRVLDAVGVIFSTRCWIEQRRASEREEATRKAGRSNLFLDVQDMESFLERFGASGLARLNAARETINAYRHETLERLLERGVVVPGTDGLIVWGAGGLRIGVDALFKDATDLFYSIYRSQQRFNLPIDNTVKRAARNNIAKALRPDEGFAKLLITSGSIFPALKDWYDFGVLEKQIPGFAELVDKLYKPGHRCATLTKAARALQRVENLEYLATVKRENVGPRELFFVDQYHELGESTRCALRLALLTEEIPQTIYPGQEYATSAKRYVAERLSQIPALSSPTLRTIQLLITSKRELLKDSETSDQHQILQRWRQRIAESRPRDVIDTIRALALFTYAAFDFHNPEGVTRNRLDDETWQNVQNLTQNLLYLDQGIEGESFEPHYFDPLGQRIGQLLPRRLLASPHLGNAVHLTYEGAQVLDPQRAHRMIHALKQVVQTRRPFVELQQVEDYYRLRLYTWDFPGLFWRVAGTLHEEGCSIRSTHLYAIPAPGGRAADGEAMVPGEPRLIFDVLTFDTPTQVDEAWEDELKDRIQYRLEHPHERMPDNTAEILEPVLDGLSPRLSDLGNGLVRFSCHAPAANKGTRYAISRLLSERAGANLESIARDGTRDWPVPRTNFYIRIATDLESVAAALRDSLGQISVDSESRVGLGT